MLRKLILTIALALFATQPVYAVWTAQEEAELEKLVRAGISSLDAFKSVSQNYKAVGVEATRGGHARAMEDITLALNDINGAMALMFNARNRIGDGPRSQTVQESFSAMNSAATKLSNAAAELSALPAAPQRNAALTHVNSAISGLTSLDKSLGYLDWQPPNYPASIGPHGDHDRGQFSLARVGRYGLGHLNWDLARLYNPDVTPVFPEGAKKPCAAAVSAQVKAFEPFLRAWGMDGQVVLADDAATILQDEAAGSGLRPASFFQLLLQAEYMLGRRVGEDDVTDTVFSGRLIKEGMPQNLTSAHAFLLGQGQCFQLLSNANGPQWTRDQIIRETKQIGDPQPKGRLAEWIGDLVDFWKDMDNAAESWIAFFHEIPAPPGG